ncbi:MAG: hypothetical protein H6708_10420 [Kofleriaceae bacterium]|nr:hypothetical protein [Kofleriaceae bacterium]
MVARAVHALADAGAAPIAFRFRAGDGRCTRDAWLRFVVERMAVVTGATRRGAGRRASRPASWRPRWPGGSRW